MLMMMLSAGKSENMKTPNACVATMNRAVARLTGRKPVARDAEHDEVAQYAHRDKDRRVGQQFARDGGEDIRIRRFEPVGGRFEFYFAAQNVHGHQ